MKVTNPILKGFYPDPSVCYANGRYYMVCSSFQYFPGVPLFQSTDLVNWTQIGHCLTRPSQIELETVSSSGGVFAPTIRFYDGIFYMTTTNDSLRKNFYVWTKDIHTEWSEPIFVDQGGIDPSLYFEDGHAYFMSNGADDEGVPGIVQCEIDIASGSKLTPSKTIWQGSGGRYLESPHLYKFGQDYYLMAAEGGTEYGHMITYARGKDIFGPFEGYEHNPVLTNRNLGGYEIQGVGHGDLIQAPDGAYYILHLGFRQTGQYSTFHHLGREVFLTPVSFYSDGWFTAGSGITERSYEVPHLTVPQATKKIETFQNTDWDNDWIYLRIPNRENYYLEKDKLTLTGSSVSIHEPLSPTFIGLRQKDFEATIVCDVQLDSGEAGLSFYMDESHHYDLALEATNEGFRAITRLCIGNIKSIEHTYNLGAKNSTKLVIDSTAYVYHFSIEVDGQKISLGEGLTRYLSSEVAGGFTGVMMGLYAYSPSNPNKATFSNFACQYR